MIDFFEHFTRKQLIYLALMIPFALAALGVLWASFREGNGGSGVLAFVVMAIILVLAVTAIPYV